MNTEHSYPSLSKTLVDYYNDAFRPNALCREDWFNFVEKPYRGGDVLSINCDYFRYEGKATELKPTPWMLWKGHTILQLHLFESDTGNPDFGRIVRYIRKTKKIFRDIAKLNLDLNATYIIAASDFRITSMLQHYIPGFTQVGEISASTRLVKNKTRFLRKMNPKAAEKVKNTNLPILLMRGDEFSGYVLQNF